MTLRVYSRKTKSSLSISANIHIVAPCYRCDDELFRATHGYVTGFNSVTAPVAVGNKTFASIDSRETNIARIPKQVSEQDSIKCKCMCVCTRSEREKNDFTSGNESLSP